MGIAIDGEGYSIIASERNGNCLSICGPQGNKIHTVSNLKHPWYTALDRRDGSVYVANNDTSTVLKYSS